MQVKYKGHLKTVQAEQTMPYAERERRKQEIAQKKRLAAACQRKLETVTDPNYTPLSHNGDTLLINEIRRLNGEIAELTKGL